MNDVTVCIPSIAPRGKMLTRALASVTTQTRPADAISVVIDHDRSGAARVRNETWRRAHTDWVAFLDDDDELLPHHLEHLLAVQADTGADLVYPWHRIIGPDGRTKADLLGGQGVPFEPSELDVRNFIPVTILVRRELLIEVDGFPIPGTPEWPHEDCEDWACWRRIRDAGGVFVHTPEVTWLWHHHGQNTSGRGDRWPGKPVFA
jgi:hypothetical protein